MTKIDTPFLRSIHLVAGQISRRCLTFLTRVTLVVRQPLDHHLKLTITIHVTDTDFIGTIATRQCTAGILRCWNTVYRDSLIHIIPCLYRKLFSIGSFDGVCSTCLASIVQEICLGNDRGGGELCRSAIDVKSKVNGITFQRSPRHQYALTGLHCHRGTIQILRLRGLGLHRPYRETGNEKA